MALYHFHVTQVKRSAGSSAVAAAAYRAGERLYSERYDEVNDYTHKGGVIHAEGIRSRRCSKMEKGTGRTGAGTHGAFCRADTHLGGKEHTAAYPLLCEYGIERRHKNADPQQYD